MIGLLGFAAALVVEASALQLGVAKSGKIIPNLTDAEEAIVRAAGVAQREDRETAIRDSIRHGLLSPAEATRERVFRLLATNSRWIDIRPYADVLEEFGRLDPFSQRTLALIDRAELERSSRRERVEVCRRALATGLARLRRGSALDRYSAILLASADGLTELKSELQNAVAQLPSDIRTEGMLATLLSKMDLCAEGDDREDGTRRAAGRLMAMDTEAFGTAMDQDVGFREAVIEVTAYACADSPFHRQRTEACATMATVVGRQVLVQQRASQFEDRRKTGTKARGWVEKLLDMVQ